jgi:hypothetical protein
MTSRWREPKYTPTVTVHPVTGWKFHQEDLVDITEAINTLENGHLLHYGFRVGDYVVEREGRLDHAMQIDRIVWSTHADVTYVASGWKGRVYLSDLERVKDRIASDNDE